MEYVLIYLALSFILLEFCSFLYVDLVHILLDLYLSISFWEVLVEMVLCFKIHVLLVYC